MIRSYRHDCYCSQRCCAMPLFLRSQDPASKRKLMRTEYSSYILPKLLRAAKPHVYGCRAYGVDDSVEGSRAVAFKGVHSMSLQAYMHTHQLLGALMKFIRTGREALLSLKTHQVLN